MDEKAALEVAFRRRIANATRTLAGARSAGNEAAARAQAARIEDAFDQALRVRLGGEVLAPAPVPRPRSALTPR